MSSCDFTKEPVIIPKVTVHDGHFKPEKEIRVQRNVSKVIFFCYEQCTIVFRRCVMYGLYSKVDEEHWHLKEGISAVCLCFFDTRDAVIDFVPFGNTYDLRVFKHEDQEILCISVSTNNDLFAISAEKLALRGKTRDLWVDEFRTIYGTNMPDSNQLVDIISISEIQHKLLYFNLYKQNNEACRLRVKYAGHFYPMHVGDTRCICTIESIIASDNDKLFNPYFEKYSPEWWSLEYKRRLHKTVPRRKYRTLYSYRSF